jgi:nucleotide-binding universal stress UspA family protein
MSERWQHHIVVGVSGSLASQAALGWAVGEATSRNAALHVVHAWDPQWHPAPYALSAASRTAEQERQNAYERLAAAMRAEFGQETPEGVTAELAEGAPEHVLVERSGGSDLLVVGSAAVADSVGRSAGPVVRVCLTRARCPLVVISTAISPAGIRRARQLTLARPPGTMTFAQNG